MDEKKRIYKKWLAIFTAIMMLSMSFVPTVYAQTESSRLPQPHWATPYLEAFIQQGILQGPLASCEPNRPITRAEFAKMSTTLFGYNKPSKVELLDVKPSAWYAKSIAFAVGEGFFDIKQGKALPNDLLTRADAAVMIGKMLKYDVDSSSSYMDTCIAKGYFVGDLNGDILPQKQLTRGEATKLLYVISGQTYNQQGIYDLEDKTIKSNVTITSPGVTLKNTVIEGDLYITEGVGTGEVTLENIEVKGETIISGGGMDSIIFINTKMGRLKVDVPDGTPVRIVASGDSSINMVAVRSECKLQDEQVTGNGFKEIVISVPEFAKVSLDGNFESVTLDSPHAKLDVLGGDIGRLTVSENAKDADVKLASTVTLSDLIANTPVNIGGTGKIENATITSPGVTIAQKPNHLSISQGVTAQVNNSIVGWTETPKNTNNSSGSSGGSGSSGDSGDSEAEGGSSGGDNETKALAYHHVALEQKNSATLVRMVFDEQVAFYVNNVLASSTDIASAFIYQGKDMEGSVYTSIINEGKVVEFYISEALEPDNYHIRFNPKLITQNWELKGINSNATFPNLKNIAVPFQINNPEKPSFTLTAPEDVTVFEGETATFSVTTSSSIKLDYQWYRDGVSIAGATNATYTFTTTMEDNGSEFFVKAWLTGDGMPSETVESSVATLTVKPKTDKPSFSLTGPENVTVFEGETATFSVTTPSSLNLNYQWYRDGVSIANATNATYTFTTTRQDNGAKFFVKVWTVVDDTTTETVESAVATLTVKEVSTELSSLSIQGKGITENLNFTGFVPPTIEVLTKPTTDAITLQVATKGSDYEVLVITKNNPTDIGSAVSASSTDSNMFLIPCNANMQYKEIIITVSFKSNPAKQSQYSIEVINNSPLIVTGPGFLSETNTPLMVDGTTDAIYWIRYLKPQETFTGIEYSINDGAKEKLNRRYFGESKLSNGIIQVNIRNSFISSLDVGDKITFTFTFSGGTVGEKVSTLIKTKPATPGVGDRIITAGEPKFIDEISSDDINANVWLKIFVPLFLNGEPVTYSDVKADIPSIVLKFYMADPSYYAVANSLSQDTTIDGIKGALVKLTSSQLVGKIYETSDIASVSIELRNTQGSTLDTTTTLELAGTPLTSEIFEFKDNTGNLITTLAPTFNTNTYSYTLTLDNITWPLTSHFIKNASTNHIVPLWLKHGDGVVRDENDKPVSLYKDTEKNELVAYLLPFNAKPLIYAFDLKGNSLLSGNHIVSCSAKISGRYLEQSFNDLDQNYKTIQELKEHSLDFDQTTYTIGTKGDGSPLQISLKKFVEKIYGTNPLETTNITFLDVGNMQTWFNIFDFNPYKDTISNAIIVKPVLQNVTSPYKPFEVSASFQNNSGSLSKIKLQNANDITQEQVIDITSPNTDINISVPYSEILLSTTSTSNYECVVYNRDGLPLDEKKLILEKDKPTDIAIVVGKPLIIPKIYKLHLTYIDSPTPANRLAQ